MRIVEDTFELPNLVISVRQKSSGGDLLGVVEECLIGKDLSVGLKRYTSINATTVSLRELPTV